MVSIDAKTIGSNIKKLMQTNNISVLQLQAMFGFNTPQAIYKWLRGRNMPTVDNLVNLADIFNCSIDDIIAINNWG